MTKTALSPKSLAAFVGVAALLIVSQIQMRRSYTPLFPALNQLVKTPQTFQDAAFIAAGFRRLGADVAWVQLLQNMGDYGTSEEFGRNFPQLKNETLRVTRIDPYFHKAYLFGAATLAWLRTINRPAEALEVLQEGIRYNPTYWPFRMYVAGVGYKVSNQFDKMVAMLEDAVQQPDCPTTVKSVLANAYKKQKRYADAIAVWEVVLASPQGRDYHDRARHEIPILRELLKRQNEHPAPLSSRKK
jgi:tetratricopeptide (TPR) repeat protein